MSVRNRGNYSDYGGRRSGSMAVFRQIALFLSLGLLSFLLGFFVLARLMPTGHGPETPVADAPAVTAIDSRNSAASMRTASAPTHSAAPTVTAAQPGATAPNRATPQTSPDRNSAMIPTPRSSGTGTTAGPTIDPDDTGQTQQPSSLDDTSGSPTSSHNDVNGAPTATRAAGGTGDNNGSGVTAANNSPLTIPQHRHRRRRRHTPPAARATPPAEQPETADQPPAPDLQPSTMDGTDQPAGGAGTQDQNGQDHTGDQDNP